MSLWDKACYVLYANSCHGHHIQKLHNCGSYLHISLILVFNISQKIFQSSFEGFTSFLRTVGFYVISLFFQNWVGKMQMPCFFD